MEVNFEKLKQIFQNGFRLSTKVGKIKKSNLAYITKKSDKKTEKALAEIDQYHNHSWYEEIYSRNKDRLDSVALVYRGNEITYREMFEKMTEMSKALQSYGVQKGDEIPICMSNTPELIYLMGAISMIGAKMNVFGPKFDSEYVTKILKGTKSKVAFIEDNYFDKLKGSIDKSYVKDVVLVSLADSLKNGIHPLERESNIEKFTSKVEEYKNANENVQGFYDFMGLGKDFQGTAIRDVKLDDEFSITYTSGSTNSKHPKQIVHNNRSFITIARYHDKDMVGGIDMSRFTVEALLPTYSNTDLISCISDSLMQGSKLALEPIGDRDFFIDSLRINEPNYVVATTSYWIKAMKEAMYNPAYYDLTMPYLLFAFAAGEGMSVNEEIFLNRGLRKVKAGTKFLPVPVVMSAAGGDCEHGGIFYRLMRRLSERRDRKRLIQEAGLKLMDFAELAVLDYDGTYCAKGEYGRIVANSGCSMEYYKDDPEATEKFFVKDAYGKTWGDCSIYGYVDRKNKIHIKGRIPKEGEYVATFLITDEMLKDQDNILSALTVRAEKDGETYYIVHYEKMPWSTKSSEEIMREAQKRIQKGLGNKIVPNILFREHDFYESFAVNGSGKRDFMLCQNEGVSEKSIAPEKGYQYQK